MSAFKKRLLLGTGVVLGILVLYGLTFYFLVGDISAQAQAVSDNRELVTRRTELLATLASLKANSSQVDAYQKQIDTLLPTKDQLIAVPHVLDSMAHADQLSLDFGFDGTAVAPSGNQLGYNSFHLGIQGNYQDILNFLQVLELRSSQFLISLSGFDLVQNGSTYQFTSQGKMYFRQ